LRDGASVGATDGCHDGKVGSTLGLEVVGEFEENAGSDDGILEGKSVGLTDGDGVEAEGV
jgi:hypothetical protein